MKHNKLQSVLSWWNVMIIWHSQCYVALVPKQICLSLLRLLMAFTLVDKLSIYWQLFTNCRKQFFQENSNFKTLHIFHSYSSRNPLILIQKFLNKIFNQKFEKEVTVQWTRCTVRLWAVILHQWMCFPSICVFFTLIQNTETRLPRFPSYLKFSPAPDFSKTCSSLVLCPVLSLTYHQCYQILRRWSSFTLHINNTKTNMMEGHRFIETG